MSWLHTAKNWLKEHWRLCFIAALAMTFFFGVSAFNYYAQSADFIKWSSPDESANYEMAKHFAQTGQLTLDSPYNMIADGIIRPRSLRADGAELLPMSFLGIMLWYGQLAAIFGLGLIPYLTPLLAALGLIFFYLLIKRLFSRNVAVLSAVLLAGFPVYIYYSARSMFHNIPFIVLLVIGLYFMLLSGDGGAREHEKADPKQKYLHWLYALTAGLGCGAAATMRSSELMWLGPVLLLIWLFNLKQYGWFKPLLFAYGFIVAFAPIFYFNQILYGAPLASGYPNMDTAVANIVSGSGQLVKNAVLNKFDQAEQLLKQVYHNFFYFGFKPEQSWHTFNYYMIKMFPWLWLLGLTGLIIFCLPERRRRKADVVYLLVFFLISVILIFYYGSWKFSDNPSADITIGNSYTRYWLPIYLMALPLAALAIVKLSKIFRHPVVVVTLQSLAVAGIVSFGLYFVLYGSEEGLVPTAERQNASRQEFNQVLSLTEANSIIITRYHDKLFFPERQVIIGLFNDEAMNERYARLAARVPLYYYNFTLSDNDLNYLNNKQLKTLDLNLTLKQKITDKFSLYELAVKQ